MTLPAVHFASYKNHTRASVSASAQARNVQIIWNYRPVDNWATSHSFGDHTNYFTYVWGILLLLGVVSRHQVVVY